MSGVVNVLLATTDEGGGGGGGSFSATASPNSLNGFVVGSFGGTVVSSEPSIVSVTGGVAPFTYAWTRVSGSVDVYSDQPISSYTYLSSTFTGGSDSRTATFKCTVTDATSATTDTNNVTCLLIFEAIHIGGGAFP